MLQFIARIDLYKSIHTFMNSKFLFLIFFGNSTGTHLLKVPTHYLLPIHGKQVPGSAGIIVDLLADTCH